MIWVGYGLSRPGWEKGGPKGQDTPSEGRIPTHKGRRPDRIHPRRQDTSGQAGSPPIREDRRQDTPQEGRIPSPKGRKPPQKDRIPRRKGRTPVERPDTSQEGRMPPKQAGGSKVLQDHRRGTTLWRTTAEGFTRVVLGYCHSIGRSRVSLCSGLQGVAPRLL